MFHIRTTDGNRAAMNDPRLTILERLWPSRRGQADQGFRMGLVQLALTLLITAAAGPEIFAAMEMTALLELLGAGLFLTAYAAGVRLLANSLGRAVFDIAFPAMQVVILRSNAPPRVKAAAALHVLLQVTWCLLAAVIAGAFGHHLWSMAS